MKNFTRYTALTITVTLLAACQTIGITSPDNIKTEKSMAERMDLAIEKAALAASKNGSKSAALLALEKKYKRNPDDPATALEYAKSLRKANRLNLASIVLFPFAELKDAHAGVKSEMSMITLALGDYDLAEKYAQEAVLQDPEDYQAYQNLGIALDAKEMHPEAERAFRKGLENWKGDPTSIMNNLALNLATQGFIDEAIEVLERAKALSPDRIELERNLRIIRTLNER